MIRAMHRRDENRAGLAAGCGFLKPREIDAWFAGTLSERRRRAWHEHSESCDACTLLAADLETFHDVSTRGILPGERREFSESAAILRAGLRRRLEQVDARKSGLARLVRSWWGPALGLAGAAALIAVAAVPMFLGGGAPVGTPSIALPGGGAYDVHAFPFVDRPTMRGAISLADLWKKAHAAYAEADYGTAESLLATIAERTPEDHDAWLYRGSALIMLQSYADAMRVLDRARELGSEQGLHAAGDEYLFAIAAWNAGDPSAAIDALRRAASAGGHYGNEAAKLLQRLDTE